MRELVSTTIAIESGTLPMSRLSIVSAGGADSKNQTASKRNAQNRSVPQFLFLRDHENLPCAATAARFAGQDVRKYMVAAIMVDGAFVVPNGFRFNFNQHI
jgi:hypothetical protein